MAAGRLVSNLKSLISSLLVTVRTEISACKSNETLVPSSRIFLVLGSFSLRVNNPLVVDKTFCKTELSALLLLYSNL